MAHKTYRSWPETRVSEITSKLARLGELSSYPFRLHVHPSADRLAYFPSDLDQELEQWSPEPFRHYASENQAEGPRIVIVQSIGVLDEARQIWELRENLGPDAIIVLWMWDNHTAYIPNMRSALAADLVFFSHSPHANYQFNPSSAVTGHVPACSAQWRRDEAAALFLATDFSARRHSLLVNYVDYGFATERNSVIAAVRTNIPEATVLTMPSDNRERYFQKNAQQRFAEWAEHKAALVLPIDKDLSTRLFDALLCGVVPVVPTNIPDFDLLIAEDEQQRLGIVRINSYEVEEIRHATQLALWNFDQLGREGALARHLFALEHHLLINRITAILHTIYMLIDGSISIRFADGRNGPALYVHQANSDGQHQDQP
ncbi:MAG: hypothetical protein FD157_108 [Rhodocyclaceae bacterium]|nr:MAG: hypothetical protein FD157_108 [Rhodocyclaceae bacterium]TND04926.1 MAG: hypothetical protein FD118_745 [Rhodocyclaceae bacterium]